MVLHKPVQKHVFNVRSTRHGPLISDLEPEHYLHRRFSLAWTGFMKAAKEMAEQGTFTEFANGYPGGGLTVADAGPGPEARPVDDGRKPDRSTEEAR